MTVPFLRWPGGKRKLLPEILEHLPDRIDRYHEPFVGGGAVFFALADRIGSAVLSDTNADLVNAYRVVRDSLPELEDALADHAAQHHDPDYYYRVRDGDADGAIASAARFVYLNTTCFNGLQRFNQDGRFNVARGTRPGSSVLNRPVLRAASRALRKARLVVMDFEHAAPPGADFVYCDPPYDGTFAGYTADGFGDGDQVRLRDAAMRWSAAGAAVLLSNADTPFVRELYGGQFTLRTVSATRAISMKASSRGAVRELLMHRGCRDALRLL